MGEVHYMISEASKRVECGILCPTLLGEGNWNFLSGARRGIDTIQKRAYNYSVCIKELKEQGNVFKRLKNMYSHNHPSERNRKWHRRKPTSFVTFSLTALVTDSSNILLFCVSIF